MLKYSMCSRCRWLGNLPFYISSLTYLIHSQLDLRSERHEGTHHGHHPEEEEEHRGTTASHSLQLDDAQHQHLERQNQTFNHIFTSMLSYSRLTVKLISLNKKKWVDILYIVYTDSKQILNKRAGNCLLHWANSVPSDSQMSHNSDLLTTVIAFSLWVSPSETSLWQMGSSSNVRTVSIGFKICLL